MPVKGKSKKNIKGKETRVRKKMRELKKLESRVNYEGNKSRKENVGEIGFNKNL